MEWRLWSSGNPADGGLGFSRGPWSSALEPFSVDPAPRRLSSLLEEDGGSAGRGEEVLERPLRAWGLAKGEREWLRPALSLPPRPAGSSSCHLRCAELVMWHTSSSAASQNEVAEGGRGRLRLGGRSGSRGEGGGGRSRAGDVSGRERGEGGGRGSAKGEQGGSERAEGE